QTVLNDQQKEAFKQFIENGGGFVGIHAATDTEYDWPWYNRLVGAYFAHHPKPQQLTYHIIDKKFPATKGLPDSVSRMEEIYDFKSVQTDSLHFLITADESTYTGGQMGSFHPAAWYHSFDGGRAFYIAWGHFSEAYNSDAMFQDIVWKGLKWAMKK
ncbi:MAG: ThuA domain-containing protein, partial [Chitinophagaceae bacterium]|nr:ThuA domain-containing protein [Chitinophagaceae bacterium]